MHPDTFQSISRKHLHQEIRNLEWLGILEPVKEVTKLVNSFMIVEKKVPADSNTKDHSSQKKIWIFSRSKGPEWSLGAESHITPEASRKYLQNSMEWLDLP